MTWINKGNKKKIDYVSKKKKLRNSYYSTKSWRNLRALYLSEHTLCERCLNQGKTTLAEDIHHIRSPFDLEYSEIQRYNMFYNYNNLMSLCKKCHGEIHAQQQNEK